MIAARSGLPQLSGGLLQSQPGTEGVAVCVLGSLAKQAPAVRTAERRLRRDNGNR